MSIYVSRDIARYRFSFCRFNFCDLNIVFRIIWSRSLGGARICIFYKTKPVVTSLDAIRDRISVGSMRLVIFQWCEKIRTRRRSVAFNLHNATPRQLFAPSFSCSSPSWPTILYTGRLTYNYYINLKWYNFSKCEICRFLLKKNTMQNFTYIFSLSWEFFYSKVSIGITRQVKVLSIKWFLNLY